ncbi:MAG: PQQ-binding-like beta-propeller repeat protein [Planctomycetia bacterium]
MRHATWCKKRCLTPFLLAWLVGAVVGVACARNVDEAPADAWPMARGCPAGTGCSAMRLRLPLAEHWHRTFDKTAFGAVPVIAAGTICLGDLDGTFHALDLETGATHWSFKVEAAGFSSAAAVSLDDTLPLVVVGDDSGVVRAFDRVTGKVVWEYETDGEISGGPTIVHATNEGDAARVFVGSQDASLSCLNLADGTLRWKHSIADQIRCSPTIADGRVFIAGCDGKLHVIDAATGTEVAAVPIDGPTGTTPAAAGGRIFFGTEGGTFFGIDVQGAEVAWKIARAANAQAYRSSAAVADGLAIVGSRGKAVETFALSDGSRGWRRSMRGKVDAAAVIVPAADGSRHVALVADMAGRVAALDAATGEPLWEFDAGGGFSAGAAVAAGRVVLASDNGTVWCFQGPKP